MPKRPTMNRSLIIATVLLMVGPAWAAGAEAPEPSAGTPAPILFDQDGTAIDKETAEYFFQVRTNFGLDSSPEQVQALLEAHGIAEEWGFPMTPEELAEMLRRTEVQDLVSDRVIGSLKSLPGFAGFYFDHQNRGAPTVLLTTVTLHDEARVLFPPELREEVEFNEADHTYAELVESARVLADSTAPHVHSVAVKVKENALELQVDDAAAIDAVRSQARKLTSIPVVLTVEPSPEPDACSSRSSCYSPMRAGIRVENEAGGYGTLGFGIWHNSDKQWIVSGHLTPTGSGYYSHYIYNLGTTAENEFAPGGMDARAVYASDSQVSDDVYRTPSLVRDVKGTKYPSVGLSICLSGVSTVSCGQVIDDFVIYTLNGIPSLVGARGDYSRAPGDSGGPVYQISGSQAYAVGAHSTSGGAFARMSDLGSYMGASVLTW